MPTIRFAWNPILVSLRREVCPGARWHRQGRHWLMSDVEAQTFVRAAQARLDFQRSQAQIRLDDVTWVFGFVRGAPYPLGDTVAEESKSHGINRWVGPARRNRGSRLDGTIVESTKAGSHGRIDK
jgi:hypothetical protein